MSVIWLWILQYFGFSSKGLGLACMHDERGFWCARILEVLEASFSTQNTLYWKSFIGGLSTLQSSIVPNPAERFACWQGSMVRDVFR